MVTRASNNRIVFMTHNDATLVLLLTMMFGVPTAPEPLPPGNPTEPSFVKTTRLEGVGTWLLIQFPGVGQ